MVGFFLLRRLIELKRVSTFTRNNGLKVFCCRSVGKPVTQINCHRIDELYALDREIAVNKKPAYIANQFIHAYISLVARDETRNWCDVFVVSDYERNDCIWRIPVSEIRRIFLIASNDYPHTVRMRLDPNKGDYVVETN